MKPNRGYSSPPEPGKLPRVPAGPAEGRKDTPMADKYLEGMDETARLAAERDRYRKALSRIFTGTRPPGEPSMSSIEIAAVALHGVEAAGDHPERVCRRCGGPNVHAWSAPSPLWNQVMRGGDINAEDRFGGIVCPVCFAALTEEAGIAELWRFYAERVHVELATVTPSGRVWNERTWLWEEPDGSVTIRVPAEPVRAPSEEPRSQHRCPDCGEPTVYQAFSGGREWYCKPCDNHGMYEQGQAPPRAQMLADGRYGELRAEMRAEIDRRKAAASPASADTTNEGKG